MFWVVYIHDIYTIWHIEFDRVLRKLGPLDMCHTRKASFKDTLGKGSKKPSFCAPGTCVGLKFHRITPMILQTNIRPWRTETLIPIPSMAFSKGSKWEVTYECSLGHITRYFQRRAGEINSFISALQLLFVWENRKFSAQQIDGLVQDCSISSALAMAILHSCTNPSR